MEVSKFHEILCATKLPQNNIKYMGDIYAEYHSVVAFYPRESHAFINGLCTRWYWQTPVQREQFCLKVTQNDLCVQCTKEKKMYISIYHLTNVEHYPFWNVPLDERAYAEFWLRYFYSKMFHERFDNDHMSWMNCLIYRSKEFNGEDRFRFLIENGVINSRHLQHMPENLRKLYKLKQKAQAPLYKVIGEGVATAINNFRESGLSKVLLTSVEKYGYINPTLVQKVAIPIIMSKRDVVARAQTGCGKTSAFILPILHTLLADFKDLTIGSPQVLIISPTSCLSRQILSEVRRFTENTNLTSGCGEVKDCAVHVLVGTPGRLFELVENSMISFGEIQVVVLDEFDQLFEQPYLRTVRQIMWHTSMVPKENRQTIMVSATKPFHFMVEVRAHTKNAIELEIGNADVTNNVHQEISAWENLKSETSCSKF